MSDDAPTKTGIVESVLGIAGTRIRTFNEFLLSILIAANIYGVFYWLPIAISSINLGHKEARDDFRLMLQEDRAAQAVNADRWIETLRHRDNGFGVVAPAPSATNKTREQAGSE